MENPEFTNPQDLPIDSDLDGEHPETGHSRPVYLQWRYLGLVAVGGAAGTAIREGLSLALPATNGIPWVILAINVLGAFLLGLLVESLARRGKDEGQRRTFRLLFGTGALGGFTTYSSLAVASAELFSEREPAIAGGYAVATLLLGAIGTTAGIAIAALVQRRRAPTQGAVE